MSGSPNTPDWVEYGELPDELEIEFPLETLRIELSEDLLTKYHQLVYWCMIQSFWYYVVGKEVVNNETFDFVKDWIREVEEAGEATTGATMPHMPNGFSPTVNGWNPFYYQESRYPADVRKAFEDVEKNPRKPPGFVPVDIKPKRRYRYLKNRQ